MSFSFTFMPPKQIVGENKVASKQEYQFVNNSAQLCLYVLFFPVFLAQESSRKEMKQ